uniref:Uncharacterized protein n=1 Tax=Sphaerodactylus townsendi TaxID=933632 RepID=A0ACB8FI24_9SAUR
MPAGWILDWPAGAAWCSPKPHPPSLPSGCLLLWEEQEATLRKVGKVATMLAGQILDWSACTVFARPRLLSPALQLDQPGTVGPRRTAQDHQAAQDCCHPPPPAKARGHVSPTVESKRRLRPSMNCQQLEWEEASAALEQQPKSCAESGGGGGNGWETWWPSIGVDEKLKGRVGSRGLMPEERNKKEGRLRHDYTPNEQGRSRNQALS